MIMQDALLLAMAKPGFFGARPVMKGYTSKGGAYFMRDGAGIRNFRWHTPTDLATKGFKGGKSLTVTNYELTLDWEVMTLDELKLEAKVDEKS